MKNIKAYRALQNIDDMEYIFNRFKRDAMGYVRKLDNLQLKEKDMEYKRLAEDKIMEDVEELAEKFKREILEELMELTNTIYER